MTYTRVMYDMPPPKVGENNGYWQLPRHMKPAGALAAACIVNKTFPEVYAFLETTFWQLVANEELTMEMVSLLYRCFLGKSWLKNFTDLLSNTEPHQEDPRMGPLPAALHWLGLRVRIRGLDR